MQTALLQQQHLWSTWYHSDGLQSWTGSEWWRAAVVASPVNIDTTVKNRHIMPFSSRSRAHYWTPVITSHKHLRPLKHECVCRHRKLWLVDFLSRCFSQTSLSPSASTVSGGGARSLSPRVLCVKRPASRQLLLIVSAGDRCVVERVAGGAAGLVVVESATVAECGPMENEVGCCNTALSCSLFWPGTFQRVGSSCNSFNILRLV